MPGEMKTIELKTLDFVIAKNRVHSSLIAQLFSGADLYPGYIQFCMNRLNLQFRLQTTR